MSLMDLFRAPRRATLAATAKERLQIVLAHERADRHSPDFLPRLQNELLAVIKKYVAIDDDKVAIKLERETSRSLLEVNVELPAAAIAPAGRPARAGA
jgi:cell division topological specificity factor